MLTANQIIEINRDYQAMFNNELAKAIACEPEGILNPAHLVYLIQQASDEALKKLGIEPNDPYRRAIRNYYNG